MNRAAGAVGVVAIGRNEGERLGRCLRALAEHAPGCPVVYVDSGSTDGSRGLASDLNADVVELDLSVPFTAARARNAGAERLRSLHPDVAFIQVIDGDCEIQPGWLERAVEAMGEPQVAVVCGRRREREPEASVYNQLIDIEWNTPVGETFACGGDALIRVQAFEQVGGYDSGIIAGEEPDMCLRMRRRGWRVLRIDCEMTLHDAAITRFGQWWKRAVRSGFAYADGALRHGRGPERYNVRQVLSILVWSLGIPGVGLLCAVGVGIAVQPLVGVGVVGLFVGLYVLQALRLAMQGRRRGLVGRVAVAWGVSIIVGKFAEMVGVLTCLLRRMRRADPKLIEYKHAPTKASTSA